MSVFDYNYLNEQYNVKQKSVKVIAKENNTYSNKILRAMTRVGIERRSQEEAQAVGIEKGRHKHPPKGGVVAPNTRVKISKAVAKNWEGLSKEQLAERSNTSKTQWLEMTVADRANLSAKAAKAVRMAAEKGSLLERFLLGQLKANDYTPVFPHPKLADNVLVHLFRWQS